MSSLVRRYLVLVLGVVIFNAAFVSTNAFAGEAGRLPGVLVAKLDLQTQTGEGAAAALDAANPKVKAAMDVQDRHHRELRGIPDVIGTGTGVDESGNPAVVVFARKTPPAGAVPRDLEGVPVRTAVTGEVTALGKPSAGVNNTATFTPPAPIGVSTGNIGECSAGTIGCRLKDANGSLYSLSNNHVYALENGASPGSACTQPGLYDVRFCNPSSKNRTYNIIGALATFVPISFGSGQNYVDCAVSTVVSTSGVPSVDTKTPSTGYGQPNSKTWFDVNGTTPPVGLAVQKYGRTTSLTKGSIYAINVHITVDYGASGTAEFVNQIAVNSATAFIKAGDSGSLLVTNDADDYPVGLLYAGNSSGTFAYANPIDAVLTSLGTAIPGLVIDGK